MSEPPMVILNSRVCSTREAARQLVNERPDVSPELPVYLQCDKATTPTMRDLREKHPHLAERLESLGVDIDTPPGVEIVTPTFFDELLKAWPKAQLVGANKDVQESFDLVKAAS